MAEMAAPVLVDGAEEASTIVILAHGAGAPMDSPFMTFFAEGIAAAGCRVVRFEFPFMTERRISGTRRPPDRSEVLLATWRTMVRTMVTMHASAARLVIGGKSLGGRMASMVADEVGASGFLCLGYPFHPPGQPAKARIAHLLQLATPALILQGTRDPLGAPSEVAGYPLSPAIRLHWLADGDHGFKPRASSGRTERDNFEDGLHAIMAWLAGLDRRMERDDPTS